MYAPVDKFPHYPSLERRILALWEKSKAFDLLRQQIKGKGFRKTETSAVLMDDGTRKQVLVAYQKRKQDEIRHPYLNEKIAIGLLPYAQALLLARHLRGDLDGYPAFLWK